jgi:hypothetical protein
MWSILFSCLGFYTLVLWPVRAYVRAQRVQDRQRALSAYRHHQLRQIRQHYPEFRDLSFLEIARRIHVTSYYDAIGRKTQALS